MRVKDAAGQEWLVKRRVGPWQKIVQPVRGAAGEYTRYRVAPVVEPRAKAKERRESRKAGRARKLENTRFKGRQWLYLAPMLIVGVVVVGIAGEALELLGLLLRLAVWLVLLPFRFAGLLVRSVLVVPLWLARLTGLVRSRVVDVVGGSGRITSLSKPAVSGLAAAGHLVRAVADGRTKTGAPFAPSREQVLADARAEVRTHSSLTVRTRSHSLRPTGGFALLTCRRPTLCGYPYFARSHSGEESPP